MTLSPTAIAEKNKLGTDSLFLLCLAITIPGVSTPIRIVRDNAALTWCGYTWQCFPFEIDPIGNTNKGEIPQVVIRVANQNRVMEAYIQQYDTYCKTYGFSPIAVDVYVVNTKAIALDGDCDPECEYSFLLKQPKTNSQWATFTLGGDNVYSIRIPQGRVLKNVCRFKFKGVDGRCGYTGSATTCNKSLSSCRALGNSVRFGGFPGAGSGGLSIAST